MALNFSQLRQGFFLRELAFGKFEPLAHHAVDDQGQETNSSMAYCHAPGQATGGGQDNVNWRIEREARKAQGQYPSQGGASVSGDQVSIRLSQDALSWFGKEHGTNHHIVCTEQFMDGEETDIGREWMSASKTGRKPSVRGEIA